jgi:hypothetical protein
MPITYSPASVTSYAVQVIGAALLSLVVGPTWDGQAAEESSIRFFRERIEPVLRQHCYACHSAKSDTVEADLRLDSRQGILEGGDRGPAIDASDRDRSPLLLALRHEDGLEMPPDGAQLSSATVADFAKWIEMGAPDPRANQVTAVDLMRQEGSGHWAFQPVRMPQLPAVVDPTWLNTPVDNFVLAKLEQRGWKPAPPVSRSQWIRRVYFDLTGMPPTPETIQSFCLDPADDAYQKVVDQLLASPRYGERWAQHWLDVVRYAETEGFEYDRHLPDAWRFRDYVIDSWNREKPFSRFLTEQIAGDELDSTNYEHLVAAILHRLGPVRRNAGNPDIALSRNEVLTERTNVIGEAFLGLTIGCARCHNHKLEPILQEDYYRLQAYFAATREHNVSLTSVQEQQVWDALNEQINQKIKQLKEQTRNASDNDLAELEREIADWEAKLPPALPTIPSIRNDWDQRTPIHVLRRGVWEEKGKAVGPRPPSVLLNDDQSELPADATKPRRRLADWLADPRNPLTARVLVNRIWQHHFGRGLVGTPNDFGTNGDAPSHPELLDWLSAKLVSDGWQVKPLHRAVVLSSVYRQSSFVDPAWQPAVSPEVEDPENRMLWRFNRRRLEAEQIRDAMLWVSGCLNRRMHGTSVMVPVDPELKGLLYKPTQWQVTADHSEHNRRSIYLIAKRNLRLPFMEAFDTPALQTSCAQRETSTHAPQALELLNGSFANRMAQAFASRLTTETSGQPDAIVDRAFWLATGRPPTAEERAFSLDFLREQPLSEFALAILNLNAFVYIQ